ncbi:MAG: endolytic transglycosylase MltG [Candidatus Niyogibacteria bacterium]|nr:endolytic transglycosylase MltG [Candidatus Niyogibacteria bacterium]
MEKMIKLTAYLQDIEVLKSEVLISAFKAVDRADFMPKEAREMAYLDEALPIGESQTISQPYTVAFMLELLNPRPGEKIMDIGAGSGWQSAILAAVVSSGKSEGKVFSIERLPYLCEFGKKNIEKYNFIKKGIIKHYCQDALEGLADEAPFDKIIAAAALNVQHRMLNIFDIVPLAWKNQLKINGVIVVPIGSSIWKFIKKEDNVFEKQEFPGFAFVPFVYPVRSKTPEPSTVPFATERTPVKNKIKILSLMLAGVLFLTGIFYYLFFSPPYREFPEKTEKIFNVEKGKNLSEISRDLKNKGFVKNNFVFKTVFSLMAGENKIKAGDYLFEKPLSVWEIKNRLAKGIYGIAPLKVTIPEGWTVKDIGFYFENLGTFSAEEFYSLFTQEEGYLFPDTYFFNADNLNPEIIAKTMRENFEKKITPEITAEIERQGKNLKEIIIMASIIEKEMGSDDDARVISGILWKRFEAGMGLQADATLTYIIAKPSLKLTEEDLAVDSPYNTYKYRGLPPAPISNPGLKAIQAAIFPEKSPYWYYLHDREGQPHYAVTFEEHIENKQKYLQ